MDIIGIVGAVLIYLTIFSLILGWVLIAYFKIKCRNKQNCKNDKCIARPYCNRTCLSDAEHKKLENMLSTYEKKLNANESDSSGE